MGVTKAAKRQQERAPWEQYIQLEKQGDPVIRLREKPGGSGYEATTVMSLVGAVRRSRVSVDEKGAGSEAKSAARPLPR